MGATQGKSKKEQKEEAREWARTKENEVAELYAQNTELRNQILMMQEDMRALRDMLKGQQSALNESVKQMEERMTEMENDVKVVPFCTGGGSFTPMSQISSQGEQEIYYRNEINDENDHRAWEKEEKRQTYTTSCMRFGRVYSLKQFEKVYVDEFKFKKITMNQYGFSGDKPHNYHYPPRFPGSSLDYIFPHPPYPPHKFMRLEPDTQPF
jgi:DNA repair exonuclease SbcCD ATPase subunit